MGGGGVDLPLFLVEVGRGQVEGPQALEDESAGPVHRTRGELQLVRVDRHLDAEHELLDDPLVPAPELLADDRVGRGDEPQRRVGGEGVEDLLDFLARSDQVGEELVLPRRAAAVEVGVLLAPRALLRVELEDEVVGIEDSRVDELDGREDVPAVVFDLDDDAVAHAPEVFGNGHVCARGVRDEQVEIDREIAQAIEKLGHEVGVEAVNDHGDPARVGDVELRVDPPLVGEAGVLPSALAHDVFAEVGRVLGPVALDASRNEEVGGRVAGSRGVVLGPAHKAGSAETRHGGNS